MGGGDHSTQRTPQSGLAELCANRPGAIKIRHYLKNMEAEESLDLGENCSARLCAPKALSMPPGDEESEGDVGLLWQALIRWGGNAPARLAH